MGRLRAERVDVISQIGLYGDFLHVARGCGNADGLAELERRWHGEHPVDAWVAVASIDVIAGHRDLIRYRLENNVGYALRHAQGYFERSLACERRADQARHANGEDGISVVHGCLCCKKFGLRIGRPIQGKKSGLTLSLSRLDVFFEEGGDFSSRFADADGGVRDDRPKELCAIDKLVARGQ